MNDLGSGESRIPYRQQVIRALVQRYIESARREFEEAKRKDVGNRITELSKVIIQLHSEMKQIHSNLFDYSDKPKGDPSGGSSFLGKYILGAKNNFKGFSNERNSTPIHEPIRHEEPAETLEEKVEESNHEGETDNAGTEETGNDDVTEISLKEEEAGVENNTNTSETVINMESSSDSEGEAGGKTLDGSVTEEAKDKTVEFDTDGATGGAETEENGEAEGSNGTTEDVNEGGASEGIKFDLSQGNLVGFLAKRIGEKLERTFSFVGNQASSPTGSDDSQDTGFGSQEFDPSTGSP